MEEIDESVFGVSIKKLMMRSIKDPFHFGTSYSMRNDFNPDTLWGRGMMLGIVKIEQQVLNCVWDSPELIYKFDKGLFHFLSC